MASVPEALEHSDRYSVVREIGEGGMGKVFEARDNKRGHRVAVKSLKHEDVHTLYALKKEFRALAGLSHPNLVDLYEMVVDGQACFFTMELVDGATLLDYCRPRGQLHIDRTRSVLVQVTRALLALHAAGMVHRDIKPQNVLVTGDGRVVVLDFGLVTSLRTSQRDTDWGFIVGTVGYMAPEQAHGDRAAPAIDWYAVGALLYEVLTGELPFRGSVMEVLTAKQERMPARPETLDDSAPDDLCQLCMELLETHPEQRPDGLEILARLGAEPTEQETSVSNDVSAVPFAGRDEELAILASAFEQAESGRARAVLLRGPSGMGKSSLCRRFIAQLRNRRDDVAVFSGRCYDTETVPFKAFDKVIDQLSQYWGRLDAKAIEALVPDDIASLLRVFPVLGRVRAVANAARGARVPDAHLVRERAFAALRTVFGKVAENQPVVLFIDDLQWSDAESLELLRALLDGDDAPPLLAILAAREESVTGPISVLAWELESALSELELGPLEVQTASALARELLPERHAALAARVAREARGVPLFVAELSRHFITAEPSTDTTVTLDDVLRVRLSSLPDDARRLLELLAVAREPVSQRVTAWALGISGEQLTRTVRKLRAQFLVRAPGGRETDLVECYHDRIRESVMANLARGPARDHHRALAGGLEQWSEGTPEMLARHWDRGGDPERAAEYAIEAAELALESYEFSHAAKLYEFALERGKLDKDQTREMWSRLAHCLEQSGLLLDAAGAYLASMPGGDDVSKLEARYKSATALLRAGYLDDGLAALQKAMAEVGMQIPRSQTAAMCAGGWRRMWLRLRGLGWKHNHESEIPRRELIESDMCASVAIALAMVDTPRASEFQARATLLALRHGEPSRVHRALAQESMFLAVMAKHDRAAELADRVFELTGDDEASSQARSFATWTRGAICYYRDSAWAKAGRHFADARSLMTSAGSWELITVTHFLGLCLLFLGDIRELREEVRSIGDHADRQGNRYGSITLRTRYNVLMLMDDDIDGARAVLEDTIVEKVELMRSQTLQHIFVIQSRARLAIYEQEPMAALETIAELPLLNRVLARITPVITYEFAEIRGRLLSLAAIQASSPKKRKTYLKELDRAIKAMTAKALPPISHATALYAQACRARVAGDDDTAVSKLREGIDAMRSLETMLYVHAGRYQLGRILGGDEGAEMTAEAERALRAKTIVNPARYAQCLLPMPD